MTKQEDIHCTSTAQFPKQALIMLQNSLDTENRGKMSNWAGSIKECLEFYGFQDVWAQDGVRNEAAFLSAIRQKMI